MPRCVRRDRLENARVLLLLQTPAAHSENFKVEYEIRRGTRFKLICFEVLHRTFCRVRSQLLDNLSRSRQFRLKTIGFFGHGLCSLSRMTKTITLSLAVVIVVGSFAVLRRSVTHASIGPYDPRTCGDQYNALVLRAKQSLASDDRVAAIHSLLQARDQLQQCQELQEQNAKAPHAVALNTY